MAAGGAGRQGGRGAGRARRQGGRRCMAAGRCPPPGAAVQGAALAAKYRKCAGQDEWDPWLPVSVAACFPCWRRRDGTKEFPRGAKKGGRRGGDKKSPPMGSYYGGVRIFTHKDGQYPNC